LTGESVHKSTQNTNTFRTNVDDILCANGRKREREKRRKRKAMSKDEQGRTNREIFERRKIVVRVMDGRRVVSSAIR
jgi:hypothetical protein